MVRISWSMVWSQRTTKSQWLETTWMLCGSVERWEELEGFAVYNDHWGTQADRGSTIISHCHLHMRSWDSLWQGRQSMHQLLNASTGSSTHHFLSHFFGQSKSNGGGLCQSVRSGVQSAWVPERRGGLIHSHKLVYEHVSVLLVCFGTWATLLEDRSWLDKVPISLCKISSQIT